MKNIEKFINLTGQREDQLRDREFVAYSRKLIRVLCELKSMLEEKQYNEMKNLLEELM